MQGLRSYSKSTECDWLLDNVEVVWKYSSVDNALKLFGNISATAHSVSSEAIQIGLQE
jgi:hypothetical protein